LATFEPEVIMRKVILAVLFTLFAAMTASAQSYCWQCYQTLSGVKYCGTTIYNASAACGSGNGVCLAVVACEGSGGDPCAIGPHCIPEKWACDPRLPEKGRWVVTSVSIARPATDVGSQQRKKS
jgi:hypothetical protein